MGCELDKHVLPQLKVLELQVITLIWVSEEAIVSLGTAWTSHNPALLAFGGDSLIELLSAAVVFWRFLHVE
jgi:hypothetical protein